MAAKKSKSAVKNRAAKKSAGKRQPTRGAAKSAAKRARRPAKRDAVKSPRSQAVRGASVTRLASAGLAREPERKPVKKAESRPNRPPAVLPIPQSTFFF
ncbi:MAG TPA: hypothetical protein VNO33_14710 [Kofleriaceae bacterium]|nr:hypothetical protein [Kofleriaceae bacterium]